MQWLFMQHVSDIYVSDIYVSDIYVSDIGLLPKYRDCSTSNDFELYLMCCGMMLLILIIYIYIYINYLDHHYIFPFIICLGL